MAKVAIKVNQSLLVDAINQAATDAKTLSELWESTAEFYNLNDNVEPITKSVVGLRVKEWNLNVPTLKANEVNKPLLIESIKDAEKNGPLKNLGELWNAATSYYNSKCEHPITYSVVCLRAKEWKIQFQTQPGKKGKGSLSPEQKEAMKTARANKPRKSRSAKFAKHKETFDILRTEAPELRHGLIKKAEGGSITALLKLKCLDCANWQSIEVGMCQCVGCPLYPIRPYQKKGEGKSPESNEADEDNEPETTGEAA